jgi:glucokinase
MIESTHTALCVDIGGTSTKAGLVDDAGRIAFLDSIPTRPDGDHFAAALSELINRTAQSVAHNGSKPRGIGIAVAGFLDAGRRRLFYNPNLAWLQDFPLKDRIAQQFDLPIELEIDSNAACMAEYRFGFHEEPARFLCLTAGTGLGVGMTIDGKPLRFAYGCMGDAGHLIVDRYGPECSCGGRGCAEALISAPALAHRYKIATGCKECVSLRDVIAAAENGNNSAIEILRDAGAALGIAIASLANTFFPDQIAIAGGLSAAGEFVIEPAEKAFREAASVLARSGTKLSRASLGPNATLIGAAWPFWKELSDGESKP